MINSKKRRPAICPAEKRRETRVSEENKVVFQIIPENEEEERAFYSFSVDVSLGGLRIMTDMPLPVRTKVKVEITLSDTKKVITGIAEVRWVKSLVEDKIFEMGLEFVDLDPHSQLFLFEHVSKKLL